jgi:NAD-dependent dihydropyrimidine dehydrogenase PreA subunit
VQGLRYLEDAVTLTLDAEKCNGCRQCTLVCPHGVFAIGDDKRAYLADRGACMECGACALNCATGAIAVKPGVGCAEAIIHSWIYGGEPTCGCSVDGASGDAGGGCCASTGPVAPPSEPRELEHAAAGPACCGGATQPHASDAGERPAPS